MGIARVMSLTPELVQLCRREEPKPAPDARWTPLLDGDYRLLARRFADTCKEETLWIFAYGSLIWKPEIEFAERLRAAAFGWHRSFCLELRSWRGSPERPGLMMALERGGRCEGFVFRVPADDRERMIERLLRREITDHEGVYTMRWMQTMTPRGPVRALGFWVGPVAGEGILLRQPLEQVAWILARACGYAGSCAEYLYNTVWHLEELGIHDRNLWRLQELVANEIKQLYLP